MNVVPTPWGRNVLVVAGDAPDPSLFTAAELEETAAFRLEKRRTEWMLSRAAAKRLAAELGICGDPLECSVRERRLLVGGRPAPWYLSLSHSPPYAAAALSPDPVGIDVQVVRPFAAEAAHLFLREEEIEAMQRCAIEHRLLHFWCAKEAAWKRRSQKFATMRQLPLTLLEEGETSLRFDDAETIAIDDVIVAVSGLRR